MKISEVKTAFKIADVEYVDGELAYTSFNKALRIFDYSRSKALQDGKVYY